MYRDSIIKKVVRAITTALLIPVTFILLVLYFFLGTIIYLWLVVRFIIVYAFAVIKSAYLNKDVSNDYLNLIESLLLNYAKMYYHICRIPFAVWKDPVQIKFEIETILSRERTLLSKNLLLNIIIIFSITLSLVWSFGLLGFVKKIFGNKSAYEIISHRSLEADPSERRTDTGTYQNQDAGLNRN